MQEFDGRVAVITGAASGIGRAIAGRLAVEGMRLVLTDIDAGALDATVASMRAAGTDAIGVPADVGSEEAVHAVAAQALEAFGAVHLLCNNAGVFGYHGRPIWEAEQGDWDWALGPNFWGVVYGIRAFLPHFLEQGEGHIAVTASVASFIRPGSMYGVTKHAVGAYCELVHHQLQEMGAPIGFTILCPGSVSTGIYDRQITLKGDTPLDSGDRPGLPAVEPLSGLAQRSRQEGVAPAEIADVLLEGIRDGRLYVFNDPAWEPRIRDRFHHVLSYMPSVPDRGAS